MLQIKLKELREKKGLSQAMFASELGVGQSTVGSWENGARKPNIDTIKRIAHYFNIPVSVLLDETSLAPAVSTHRGIRIPVLGYVPAGIPIEAVEDVLGYEEITPEMARNGEHFALKIKGDSMIPTILNGDIVIVRLQPDVESGETAIVKVNNSEATCKKVVKHKSGISLVANNPVYEPSFYSNEEIEDLPVTVVGKVIELRRTF